MNEQEIERIFTAIDPAAGLDDVGLDAVFDAETLVRRVTDGIQANVSVKTGRRWRRFRRGFTVPLVLLLIASGTAAAVALLRSPEPIRLSGTMTCYSQPLKRAALMVELNLTTTPSATCAHVMRADLKSGEATPNFASAELCVSNDDVLRVFPKSDVKNLCDTLGYAPYSGTIIIDRVSRLTSAAVAFNGSHRCATVQVATAEANGLLTANSLAGTWNVKVINRTPPTCSTLAVDDVHRIVVVVATSFPPCGSVDTKVLIGPQVIVRSNRLAYVIRTVNESDAACALVGYADVTMLGSGSAPTVVASHAPIPSTVGSKPSDANSSTSVLLVEGGGGEASFLLEFTATATSCVNQYQNLSVRVNGDTDAHALQLPNPVLFCTPPSVTYFSMGSRGPSQ